MFARSDSQSEWPGWGKGRYRKRGGYPSRRPGSRNCRLLSAAHAVWEKGSSSWSRSRLLTWLAGGL